MAMTIPAPLTARATQVRTTVRSLVARYSQVSRLVRARVGYGAGMATSAWGVGVIWGVGPALVYGGLVAAWSFLHLYPVDDE